MAYLRDELKYPGLRQAAVLRKTDSRTGKSEVWYLLTSRKPEDLPPQAFLTRIQKHWHIENGLHHVKDRTLEEDRHYTRFPNQEHCLAILRNVVVSALNLLTPPHRRKASRPVELLRNCIHPLNAFQQLRTL